MIALNNLIPLQQFDLKIDAANASINEKKQKIQRMSAEIAKDEQLIDKKGALLQKIQLRYRKAELELQECSEKKNLIKVKMESIGMKPKAYTALEKESAILEAKMNNLETAILEDMEKVEVLTADIAKGKKVVAGRKVHLEQIRLRVGQEVTELRSQIDGFKTERHQISLKVSADALEVYEELRRKKGGQVAYEIESAACPACGMTLPAGFLSAICAHNEFEKCFNCEILLHWIGDRY